MCPRPSPKKKNYTGIFDFFVWRKKITKIDVLPPFIDYHVGGGGDKPLCKFGINLKTILFLPFSQKSRSNLSTSIWFRNTPIMNMQLIPSYHSPIYLFWWICIENPKHLLNRLQLSSCCPHKVNLGASGWPELTSLAYLSGRNVGVRRSTGTSLSKQTGVWRKGVALCVPSCK